MQCCLPAISIWLSLSVGVAAGASPAQPDGSTRAAAASARAAGAALFARLPEYETARISPTGQWLAVSMLRDGFRCIAILDLRTLEPSHIVRFNPPNEADRFYWANDRRLLIGIATRIGALETPVLTGELYAVDADGSAARMVYDPQPATTVPMPTPAELMRGDALLPRSAGPRQQRLLSLLEDNADEVLLSTFEPGAEGARDTVSERLNINDGRLRREVRAPAPDASLLADLDGRVRFAALQDRGLELQVFERELDAANIRGAAAGAPRADGESGDGVWKQRLRRPFRHGLWLPLAFADADNVLVLDSLEDDRLGVLRYGLHSGRSDLLLRDARVDVDGLLATAPGARPYAIRLRPARSRYELITPITAAGRLFAAALQMFPDADLELTSMSRAGSTEIASAVPAQAVLRVRSDVEPGALYLLREGAPPQLLLRARSWLHAQQLRPTEVFDLVTRDGLPMQVFLTRPAQAADGRPPPLVLYPHGGPHGARSDWLFDELTQLLAASGYAVLRPNYRGSSGYGRAFADAGYGQWSGRMLEDLIDSLDWAARAGIADPQRVAIIGESFGAFAALQSAVEWPERFKAVIGTSGVYDLALLYRHGDLRRSRQGRALLQQMIGADDAALHARSAIAQAGRIRAPVLLIHGARDTRVPPLHARGMRDALAAAGKAVDYLEIADEGHGFFAAASRERYFTAVLSFLAEHLGETGRRPDL